MKLHSHDLFRWMGYSPDENMPAQEFSGVSVDSRMMQPGHLFFALGGERTDGHLFLKDIKEKGGTAAVVRREYQGENHGLKLLYMPDPLHALQQAAKSFLQERSKAKIVAITGSIGKTTTKEFVAALLASKYRVGFSSGNKNSQIGLAMTILNEIKGDEEFLVLEMGMTEPGHISKLVSIAPPDFALTTPITYVHAENFQNLEEIAEAKAEIFSHPQTKCAVINTNSDCAHVLFTKAAERRVTIVGYGLSSSSEYSMDVLHDSALIVHEKAEQYTLPYVRLLAPHLYQNLIGAIAMARMCGMTFEEIGAALPALETLRFPKGRLEVIEKNGITFINDSYNAAELSMKGALDALRIMAQEKRRKIAILGHMRELGKFSEECHRRVGEYALERVDELFCLGELCGPMVEAFEKKGRPVHWFLDFQELASHFQKEARPNDCVLLKGANTLYLGRLVHDS